jgi:hypothetical protein
VRVRKTGSLLTSCGKASYLCRKLTGRTAHSTHLTVYPVTPLLHQLLLICFHHCLSVPLTTSATHPNIQPPTYPSSYNKQCWLVIILWPRSLRRSAAAWLLGSRVRIPLGAWMFLYHVYVLSCVCRGLCDGLITCP